MKGSRFITCLAFAATLASVGHGQQISSLSALIVPDDVAALGVAGPLPGLVGEVTVAVRLTSAPLALANGPDSRRVGGGLSPSAQQAYVAGLLKAQDTVMAQIAGLGGRELGRVTKAHNALIVGIDAARVPAVQAIAGVAGVRALGDYQLALNTTVPYIEAAAVQTAGYDGTGIKVAVLDSGVDYTHHNLGGPGAVDDYTAAYGLNPADPRNATRDGLFPTSKVYEGFDFVGERWPNGPRAPDPDPIDFDGHGTHVADILAGHSTDGAHKGVAPGAQILAVKTCSSVSTDCSAIALLLGMDFAIDPNGDSVLNDSVHVINLSLGTDYGQREDDLSEAARVVSVFGVTVVASAGNAGDKPYVVGSPSMGPSVISVAQTAVPTGVGYPLQINAPPAIAGFYPNTATLSFAPVGSGFAATPVAYVGRGCPAGSVPGQPEEDAYAAEPAGKVALIDRGACTVSLKIDRAAKAGAIGTLIGLVAPGDAIGFAFGGGDTFVPSLVITQSTANSIKANLAAPTLVTLNPALSYSLAGSMVSSSSRGPGYSYQSIKPDIAAPGASVSAQVGTGTGETAFGGTSGAAPMVAGAAALLLQEYPLATPREIKARLMNSADPNILISPQTAPGQLAPLTRMGAGEVRVNRARTLRTVAWDSGDPIAVSLNYGSVRMTGTQAFAKKVTVRNYNATSRTYNIVPEFRYADDAASGAVTFNAPGTLTVPGNGSASFVVRMTVNANLLPLWTLNGGSRGGDGFRLQSHEYDGFVTISDARDTIRLPWHILPHKAAGVTPAATSVNLGGAASGVLALTNPASIAGVTEAFSLLGTSTRLPANVFPGPGDNFAVIDLKAAGIRFLPNALGAGQDAIQFAITTWDARSHPNYPAEFDVFFDIDRDGSVDYVVFNAENGGLAATGQNVTALCRLNAPGGCASQVVRFFTAADLNSANAIFTILRSDVLGLTAATQFDATFCAGDNYYTGLFTDCIGPTTYTLNAPRFSASDVAVPAFGASNLGILRNAAGGAASPSQTGILLMYRDARTGREADAITVVP